MSLGKRKDKKYLKELKKRVEAERRERRQKKRQATKSAKEIVEKRVEKVEKPKVSRPKVAKPKPKPVEKEKQKKETKEVSWEEYYKEDALAETPRLEGVAKHNIKSETKLKELLEELKKVSDYRWFKLSSQKKKDGVIETYFWFGKNRNIDAQMVAIQECKRGGDIELVFNDRGKLHFANKRGMEERLNKEEDFQKERVANMKKNFEAIKRTDKLSDAMKKFPDEGKRRFEKLDMLIRKGLTKEQKSELDKIGKEYAVEYKQYRARPQYGYDTAHKLEKTFLKKLEEFKVPIEKIYKEDLKIDYGFRYLDWKYAGEKIGWRYRK